ncbi:uncharacterized protein LOC111038214 isoform X1 [Myzus persicae]|uniref:uncharacterized protein LOC111038214 isoform X1 n=1 Tax=Myzus persicae TaxID=13164 RepID=UPI000B930652|nr:uncharacterized protein LOC111038214 isoform X1 [Myzus persicae]
MDFKYLLVCAVLLIPTSSGVSFDEVDDVFELTTKVFDFVSKSWEVADKVEERLGSENTPLVWFTKKKERKILSYFGHITHLVQMTQKETNDIRTMMLVSLKRLQSMSDAVLNGMQINELLESVRSIENDFSTMEEYKYEEKDKNKKNVNPAYTSYTLEKFADAMLTYSAGSPHKQLAKIHSFIVPEWEGFKFHTHGGIFNILRHTMENSDTLCDQKQSLQQLIFNLYTTLHLTQLKGYSVMQYSWMLLQTYGKGNFTFERTKQTEHFEKKIIEQLDALKSSIISASNVYWRCDPAKHIKDTTYLEVTQLLQGYIENEADMNREQSCLKDCSYYEVAEHKSCFRDQFCAKQRVCNGRILNCQYFDSDMRICQSKFGSSRRYDYISYERGKVLGDSSVECKGTTSAVDSWWTFLVWHCSYCFCICDSNDSASDRYFSLRPSVSNVNENMVITGVRFTKVKQMFHLQAQEGELGPRGAIIESSRRWIEVPGSEFSYRNKTLKDGVDYHTLTYEARIMDIDNVIAPENTVVTGLKFRKIGSHLNIEVRITPFDFMTGELIEPELKSYWIGNENTELSINPRTEIDINNSDLQTKSSTASEPDMSSNKFLKFTHSSIDRDVAQTTLPFIDMQTVAPFPGVPFSGIGIYYKGTKGFGGFIGANIFTYNLSNNISPSLYQIHAV